MTTSSSDLPRVPPLPAASPPPPPPPPPPPSPHAPSPPPPPVTNPPATTAPVSVSPAPHELSAEAFEGHSFKPLRSEPPPRLFATWWLRYLLALSQLIGIVVALLREYAVPGGIDELVVVIPHAMAAVMLVGWSAFAMLDAKRLVPATRYQQPSRWWVAVGLWLGAFAAPVVAVAAVDGLRDRVTDGTDDLLPVSVAVGVLFGCFILVWLPFRYHVRQAHRIGAPVSVVAAWFWLPLLAIVGVLLAMALGLHDLLADNGVSDLERTVQVAVLYGVPALMFAMTTWRATTVFDEVIELRWLRWRNEWEQTLLAFASQPAPGPEASPVVDRRRR